MKNVKLPHRILLIYYGLRNEFAGNNMEIRRAVSEAVLNEALLSEKIKYDNKNLVNSESYVTGHTVLDDVSEAIRKKEDPGSFEFWKRELSKDAGIVDHVTENLIDNKLIEKKQKGGFLRKKRTIYRITDKKLHLRLIDYLNESVKNKSYDDRDYLTINILKTHNLPGLEKENFEVFLMEVKKP